MVHRAVGVAVVGVLLAPGTVRGTVINVVAKRLLHAPGKVRSLRPEPRIIPIFIKGERLGHMHGEHKLPLASAFS